MVVFKVLLVCTRTDLFTHNTMIDNETFRQRIGLFLCKRPRKVLSNMHYSKTSFFDHSSLDNIYVYKIFTSPYTPLHPHTIHNHSFSNSFLNLFFSIFLVYFTPLILGMHISLSKADLSYNFISSTLFDENFPLFLCFSYWTLPPAAVMLINIAIAKFYHTWKAGKLKFCSRLHRVYFLITLWTYFLNLSLVVLANPSLLNPGPNSINVAYQNVQGLIPFSNLGSSHPLLDHTKVSEIQAFLIQKKPDILALNETWLKKSIHSNELLPNSQYDVYRNDRSKKTHPPDPGNPNKFRRNGGGVLLAVRSDLNATVKRLPVSLGLEMLALKLTFPNNESIVVCTCYRVGTLGASHQESLIAYLRSLVSSKRNPPKIYFLGDLNLSHADWGSSRSTVPIEQAFIDSFGNLAFFQLVNQSTHKSGNILDVLLTNSPSTVDDLLVLDEHSLCKSDHFPISFSIKHSFSRKKTPKRSVYNFKRANWDQMNRDLCSIDWSFLLSLHPDTGWKLLKDSLLTLADQHIPKVQVKSEFQPPWFDSELFEACRTKERLRDRFKQSGLLSDELKFSSSRKDYKRLSSKKLHDNLFNYDDPAIITKKFWAHVKFQSNSCRIPNCMSYQDQIRYETSQQAEIFNTFFYNQFSDPSNYDVDISYANDSDFDIEFDHRAVRKLLSDINSNKAQGPDGIHGKILKHCAVGLAYPLSCIFKVSYNSGFIPSEWKLANVVPIFKKGDKTCVENYRPISLTSLVMKVFERIVRDKLLLLTSDLIDARQHGFLPQRSCSTNMVLFCDSLSRSLNDNLLSHVIYFDFAKAFDSVNHDRLLSKLKGLYGIDGTLLKFLTNYLSDRFQKVVIGSKSSSTLQVNSGVPQGSILGPLLFVLFINDLPLGLSEGTDVALYADDTKIWRSIRSLSDCSTLQSDINYLNDWALLNKMKFHPSKCKVLAIKSRSPSLSFRVSYNYHLGDVPLGFVDCEKDLGVDITPKLSWNSQCDRLYTKACQQLGIVRRNGHIVLDSRCRRALYLSLVRSQFENCSIVWRPTTKSLSDKLESLQKRAIKWILSEENRSYSPEIYFQKCKDIDILPLSLKFDLNDLLFFHKVLNDLTAISLPSYLSFYRGGSRLRNCHLDNLSIVSSLTPTRSNNPLAKSFFYRTHLLWNRLPLQLRQIQSSSLFKSELVQYLWKAHDDELLDSSIESSSDD